MSGPTRREVREAIEDPTATVVAIEADGFEQVDLRNVRAALADPDREIAILDGEGWFEYAHLMAEEQRLTDDEPDIGDMLDREWSG